MSDAPAASSGAAAAVAPNDAQRETRGDVRGSAMFERQVPPPPVLLPGAPLIRNLVFKGGSVKGIAYVGALLHLEEQNGYTFLSNVRRVGGTSAGAITAALMAVGYSPAEMHAELIKAVTEKDKDTGMSAFRSFIDAGSNEKNAVVDKLVALADGLMGAALADDECARGDRSSKIGLKLRLAGAFLKLAFLHPCAARRVWAMREHLVNAKDAPLDEIIGDLRDKDVLSRLFKSFGGASSSDADAMAEQMITKGGLCTGAKFTKWLRVMLDKKVGGHLDDDGKRLRGKTLTFGQLHQLAQRHPGKFRDLCVVAAEIINTSDERTTNKRLFSSEDPVVANYTIADAVRASMSIPFVFTPASPCIMLRNDRRVEVQLGERKFVDGGVRWNYDIHMYDENRFLSVPDPARADTDPCFNTETLGFTLENPVSASTSFFGVVAAAVVTGQDARTLEQRERDAPAERLRELEACRTIAMSNERVTLVRFDVDGATADRLVESGRRAAEAFLSAGGSHSMFLQQQRQRSLAVRHAQTTVREWQRARIDHVNVGVSLTPGQPLNEEVSAVVARLADSHGLCVCVRAAVLAATMVREAGAVHAMNAHRMLSSSYLQNVAHAVVDLQEQLGTATFALATRDNAVVRNTIVRGMHAFVNALPLDAVVAVRHETCGPVGLALLDSMAELYRAYLASGTATRGRASTAESALQRAYALALLTLASKAHDSLGQCAMLVRAAQAIDASIAVASPGAPTPFTDDQVDCLAKSWTQESLLGAARAIPRYASGAAAAGGATDGEQSRISEGAAKALVARALQSEAVATVRALFGVLHYRRAVVAASLDAGTSKMTAGASEQACESAAMWREAVAIASGDDYATAVTEDALQACHRYGRWLAETLHGAQAVLSVTVRAAPKAVLRIRDKQKEEEDRQIAGKGATLQRPVVDLAAGRVLCEVESIASIVATIKRHAVRDGIHITARAAQKEAGTDLVHFLYLLDDQTGHVFELQVCHPFAAAVFTVNSRTREQRRSASAGKAVVDLMKKCRDGSPGFYDTCKKYLLDANAAGFDRSRLGSGSSAKPGDVIDELYAFVKADQGATVDPEDIDTVKREIRSAIAEREKKALANSQPAAPTGAAAPAAAAAAATASAVGVSRRDESRGRH